MRIAITWFEDSCNCTPSIFLGDNQLRPLSYKYTAHLLIFEKNWRVFPQLLHMHQNVLFCTCYFKDALIFFKSALLQFTGKVQSSLKQNRVNSVNVIKSAENCGFWSHVPKKPLLKKSIFCAVLDLQKLWARGILCWVFLQ